MYLHNLVLLRQADRQVPTLPGTVPLPRQSVHFPGRLSSFPERQADSPRQAGAHLPSWEGGSLVAFQTSQAGSQAGRQAVTQAGSQAVFHLPGDNTSSQAGSAVTPNNTLAREGPSQAGNNSPSTQAGSQAISHLPRDSTSSQAGSTLTPNTPAREGPSQAGNNPPQIRQASKQ